jgi:hypothetical protein
MWSDLVDRLSRRLAALPSSEDLRFVISNPSTDRWALLFGVDLAAGRDRTGYSVYQGGEVVGACDSEEEARSAWPSLTLGR